MSSSSSAAAKISVPKSNLDAIVGLQPEPLWRQFAILSSIPRPSKKEHGVISYIKEFATERNLRFKQDSVGNIVVFHPGSGIGTQAPPVIIQGHIDMVTEKNQDTVHDFDTDPILLRRIVVDKSDGEDEETGGRGKSELWLGATGTTLGSDNGIGVAAALALLEMPTGAASTTAAMPPIEALFTVDEETGLTGAMELDARALGLTGKTMLNLDTEEWENFYVGCSGGGESIITLPLTRQVTNDEQKTSTQLVELQVKGLLGGHSGINIDEGRANACLLAAAVIQKALSEVEGLSLVSFRGGDKHNAIPREATAQLLVPNEDARAILESIVATQLTALKAEYGTLETNIRINLVDADRSQSTVLPSPLDKSSTRKLLLMILALPAGPMKYSHMIPDLVETSNNVASVTLAESSATVLCSTRSSIPSALEATRDRLAAVAELAGARIERSESYPGWNPNPSSKVLELGLSILGDRMNAAATGGKPGVKAIHAGLECGLLIEKMGGDVDALSFGPTITGAHSPDEKVLVDTVLPFFELVQDLLSELAKKRE